MRLIKGIGAAALLAMLVAGPPWLLAHFIGNPWPGEGLVLSAPLTDGAIIGLLALAVWVLWAQLVICVIVEATAAVTDDRIQLRAPFTLGIQQQLARRLVTAFMVAAAASSFTASGAAVATAEGGQAAPLTGSSQTATSTSLAKAAQHTHDRTLDPAGSRQKAQHTTSERKEWASTVTVMRLDSLYAIAERVLGDGDRWPEIASLNEGRVMNDGTRFTSADQIQPGWELRVPIATEPHVLGRQVIVTSGDTLSGIAEQDLGEAAQWPNLYRANRGLIGADPNLILPGQALTLPAGSQAPATHHGTIGPAGSTRHEGRDTAPASRHHRRHGVEPVTPPVRQPGLRQPDDPAIGPIGDSHAEALQYPEPASGTAREADSHPNDHTLEVSGLRMLLATASCLAVGALGLVLFNRRRQFRHREPGRTVAPTPPHLVAAERALLRAGLDAQPGVEFLDRALRQVAVHCRSTGDRLPQLGAAVLGEDELALLFTEAASGQAPTGWAATDDARAWRLPRGTFLAADLGIEPAPYPALVSVGEDVEGRTWLLDLETLGTVGIAGPDEQAAGLRRFVVAELAVNAWSEGTEVLLPDASDAGMVDLNPERIGAVDREAGIARAVVLARDAAESEQNLGVDLLERRRDEQVLDTTGPVVTVFAGQVDDELLDAIAGTARSRVVVVCGDQSAPKIELAADGMAWLPMWGIRIKAFTLTVDQAGTIAALLASTRNLQDEPVAVSHAKHGPVGTYARADGSLREEYTAPRHPEGYDASSLLPDADEVYLTSGATRAEDLAALAPSIPEQNRKALEEVDPTLDEDLGDWFDPQSARPKVYLLGPVNVVAVKGSDRDSIANLAATIEFIVFLACQERGVSGERAAEACGWSSAKTVQNRATNARRLLGTRPDGGDWLPDAGKTETARRGVPTYELDTGPGAVLVDHDLFFRLKNRAQRRGEGGLEDLVTALSLVAGEPFDQLRRGGYAWLLEGQRHDHMMVVMIHDVAHVVATRALAEGRPDLVDRACVAARTASPHSDVAWLDSAAATEAVYGAQAANDLVRTRVVDREDEDLPSRTEAVIDRRGWLTG